MQVTVNVCLRMRNSVNSPQNHSQLSLYHQPVKRRFKRVCFYVLWKPGLCENLGFWFLLEVQADGAEVTLSLMFLI